MLSSTDENQQQTTYAYEDPLFRLKDTYGPPSAQNGGVKPYATFKYVDGSGASMTGTNPVGVTSTTLYDGLGRVVQTQTSEASGSRVVTTAYDELGRIYTISNPFLSSSQPSGSPIATPTGTPLTTYQYDALGRKTLQIQPDNTTTTTTANGTTTTAYSSAQQWSYNGNVTTFSDEKGNQWQRTYDGLGRLIKVVEPSGSSASPTLATAYAYDALDNLVKVTQSGLSGTDTPRVRTFTYDSLSRLLCASNPEVSSPANPSAACPATASASYTAGTTGYTYDANGNLSAKTDARGITTNYAYDALNRLLSKTYTDGTLSSCFQYDGGEANGEGRLQYEWTQAGSCAAPFSASGAYATFRGIGSYDAMGRIKQEQQCVPNSCNTTTDPQLSYGYDLAGNQTSLSNNATPANGSLVLTTGFDAGGHVNGVTSSWGAYPTALYSVPSGGYGPAGPLNWSLGPNLSVTQGYSNRLWVNSITAVGQVP